jgi:L-lactate dehydrogenase
MHESVVKIGIVGTGLVGMSCAYALLQRGVASELVLIDVDHGRAEGEAMDLNHGMPFVSPCRIWAGSYADLAGAAAVVVAAGVNQQPGQTRLDLLQQNAAIIHDITPKIVNAAPKAAIIMATNPVDILTLVASRSVKGARGRIFGSGTILDTARLRFLLAEYYRVDPHSVHAIIIGEHGDSSVPVWSLANIAGVRLSDFVHSTGGEYDQEVLTGLFQQARDAAYEIIKRKRATYYAIGLALVTIVEAVVRDERTVLTVSSPLTGQYGIEHMALSLPTIVGRGGAEAVLLLPLSDKEIAQFRQSAALLQERIQHVALG